MYAFADSADADTVARQVQEAGGTVLHRNDRLSVHGEPMVNLIIAYADGRRWAVTEAPPAARQRQENSGRYLARWAVFRVA